MPNKAPILTERIDGFIEQLKGFLALPEAERDSSIKGAWDDEIRHHFERGRTKPTITFYVAKYRAAIKEQLGAGNPALAICNTKALNTRLARYMKSNSFKVAGKAKSIDERLQRAEQGRSRTPTRLLAIADFIDRLNHLTSQKDMADLWKSTYATFSGKALQTVLNYVSQYRKAIAEAFGDHHPMMKLAAADPALYEAARAKKMEKINEHHAALITFDKWKEVVERCTQLLESHDPVELAYGLLCVTGRRPYEIGSRSSSAFTPAKSGAGQSKWSINFYGQAKTKERDGTKFGVTYEIPVLAPAKAVLAAYDRLRNTGDGELWMGMTSEDFNREPYKQLRARFSELLGDLWPVGAPAVPYKLRHLYAEIAFYMFAPQSVSKNSYFSAILGHNDGDLESSLSYLIFSLPESREDAETRAERLERRTTDRFESLNLPV